MKTLPIGPCARDLPNQKDALLVCLHLLEQLNSKAWARYNSRAVVKWIKAGNPTDSAFFDKMLSSALESIYRELNKHVPPFTYFGRHPVDHFSLGVWLDLASLHKAETDGKLTQIYGSSYKGVSTTYILSLEEDGSIHLIRRRGGKEIWATK